MGTIHSWRIDPSLWQGMMKRIAQKQGTEGAKTDLKVPLSEIKRAQKFLSQYLSFTPLIFNPWLSEAMQCEVYLKLENLQPIGSFKIRGATYRISKLTSSERKCGVIAASAGNHAQGVAWGSRQLSVQALVVMPKGASLVKIQNTKSLGAEVLLEGENYDQAFAVAQEIAKKSGRIFIHAFENVSVIAGQGTLGLEILEQLPDLNAVIGSIGGGGMMGGVATAIRALKPKTTLVGCQASGAPSMLRSIRSGKVVALDHIETFADGVALAKASSKMLNFLNPIIDKWVGATDEEIAAAVLSLLEKARLMAEGSGALPLAALEKLKRELKNQKVVLIISGGNMDVNILSRIIDRGLIRAGRRVRLNVIISDRTGSLAKLTDLIAKGGANIIQAIHDRSEPYTTIDQTDVALTLETRGPEHSKELVRLLRKNVLRLELIH